MATQLLSALDNLRTFSFHVPQFCLVLPNILLLSLLFFAVVVFVLSKQRLYKTP